MPVNVYDVTGRSAGDEISSTYEGRHLTFEESVLIHPDHADGFVDGGDPVIVGGQIVGVAFKGAAAATNLIAVDSEGIWAQSVQGADDWGNVAVAVGDQIFINRTTCVLSKRQDTVTQLPFGYALSTVSSGATAVCAVKVHFDLVANFIKGYGSDYIPIPTTRFSWMLKSYLDDGESEGLNDYVEGHIDGTTAGHIYGLGSWLNVETGAVLSAGHIIVPFEGGVWAGEAQAAARVVFAGQHQAILAGAPATLHAWRLNVAQVAGNITALIAAANPESVGYEAGKAGTGVVGTIPIADVVGTGVVYIDVHGAVA